MMMIGLACKSAHPGVPGLALVTVWDEVHLINDLLGKYKRNVADIAWWKAPNTL